ncbi:MAG: JAB domain-containing protein [Tsuneonella sp.]
MAALLEPFAGEGAGRLAERLIARFGSLGRMLAAPLAQLEQAAGDQAAACAAIHGARPLVEAVLREEFAVGCVDGSDPALLRYLRLRRAGSPAERLHGVYCDAARRFLHDEMAALGGLRRIDARARPLFERALTLGAGGFLLAHNHPSGDCRPSEEDIAATRHLAAVGAALELELVDHVIVTRHRALSLRAGGYL